MTSTFWLELLGAQVRYYDVCGVRTRVFEAGEGHPLILLHGVTGHAETFVRNVAPLAEHYHVYALDMLGHGFTAKPPVTYSVGALAGHVRDFLDTIGATRAHFVGQSLGGWVAGWLAHEQPERVGRIVMATGAGLQLVEGGNDATTERIHTQVRTVSQAALAAPTRESVRTRLEWLMFDPRVVTDELVESRYSIYTLPDSREMLPRVIADTTGPANDPYLLTPTRLGAIQAPTLLLWTRHNPTQQWEVAAQARDLMPQASWYLMEAAAHWPQFERPDEFNAVATEFLAET